MEETQDIPLNNQSLPPAIEKAVIGGDLAALNAEQRNEYYQAVCKSLGLNPLTTPFSYLTLNGKLRLYALRDCADQLRRIHGISIYITNRERLDDIYIVTARAKDRTGREDESTGVVTVGHLKGEALANALMKGETKAKRRVTLSIAGLGWLDELETETIPGTSKPVMPISTDAPSRGDTSPDVIRPTADQISELYALGMTAFNDAAKFGTTMRELLRLPSDVRLTKKWLRESMTIEQYMDCWHAFESVIKAHVESDVDDFQPPQDTREPSGEPVASPSQIAELKKIASQVSPEDEDRVKALLADYPDGIPQHIVKEKYDALRTELEEAVIRHFSG